VLLNGESGTGKELFAQAIHSDSRSNGPFVAINCASIPRNLIESELFGYEGGAFTGAERKGRLGKIEAANGGTLFLDEIEDMPLEVQSALLRVLDDKKVLRISSNKYIPVDFRLIAATNKDIFQLIKEKKFRNDLYFRLSIFKLDIPPLRDRGSDILLLAGYFIYKICDKMHWKSPKLSPEVNEILTEYYWPGNVRQLENAMVHAVYMSRNGLIKVNDLPDEVKNNYSFEGSLDREIKPLREIEKAAIICALHREKNKVKVAGLLGLSKQTLYRKIKEYGIEL
jgi:transcriptional regulator with PAS, ATPase and Fis domain